MDQNILNRNYFWTSHVSLRGKDAEFVKRVLDAFGIRYVDSTKQILINKALITITSNRFRMHDLLQEVRLEIVCQESKDSGERSRLWLAEGIYEVLNYIT